jgi:hypothetical protein
MATNSNATDLFTFFASFTTKTTMQKLTEKQTIVTKYGKFAYENYYNPSEHLAAEKIILCILECSGECHTK